MDAYIVNEIHLAFPNSECEIVLSALCPQSNINNLGKSNLRFRESMVNLIEESDFISGAQLWQRQDYCENEIEIKENLVPGINALSFWSNINDSSSVIFEYIIEIPIKADYRYAFITHVASHRCSGSIVLSLKNAAGKITREIKATIKAEIPGGEHLTDFERIIIQFKPTADEISVSLQMIKNTTLYGSDSVLFILRPWLAVIDGAFSAEWRYTPEDLTRFVNAATSRKAQLLGRIEPAAPLNRSKAVMIDSSASLESYFFPAAVSHGARPTIKIDIGVVLYQNSNAELEALQLHTRIAIRNLRQTFNSAGRQVHITLRLIDNSAVAIDLPAGMNEEWLCFPNSTNVGFGKAHNILMAQAFAAGADFYVLMNPDGFPFEECIKEMVLIADSDQSIGLVEASQFPVEHPKPFDLITYNTPWCSGECLLVSAPAYIATGGFDEHFSMYCEDVDISWRVQQAGLLTKFCPTALFYHDTRDRSSASVRLNMLLSARTLGKKWGAKDFQAWIEHQLVSEGFVPDSIYLPSLHGVPSINYEGTFAEFRQALYFALPRWH